MSGGFNELGQGIGNIFSGMLGGLAQGLTATPGGEEAGNEMNGQANLFGELFKAAAAGKDINDDKVSQELANNMLAKQLATAKGTEAIKKTERKVDFKPEEILDAEKINRDVVDKHGCYLEECLDLDILPKKVKKISFRGDGYVDDNFIRILKGCPKLDFSNVHVVDLSGCINLTDIGTEWLAEILMESRVLHKICLDGCVNVTQHGLSLLGHIRTCPEISFCGTNTSIIPKELRGRLSKDGLEFKGCHLLQSEKEENIESSLNIGKILIHQPPEPKYRLTSFLVNKQMEPAEDLTYTSEWLHRGTNFSICESVVTNPKNSLLQNSTGSHVLIPIDLDGNKDKEIGHIIKIIDYNIGKGMSSSEMSANLDKVIWPFLVSNAVWDYDTGRICIVNPRSKVMDAFQKMAGMMGQDVEDFDADEEKGISVISFPWTASKGQPYLEFLVEACQPKAASSVVGFSTTGRDLADGNSVELKISKGDVLRVGLMNPQEQSQTSVIGEDGLDMAVSINGELVGSLTVTASEDCLYIMTTADTATLLHLDHYPLTKFFKGNGKQTFFWLHDQEEGHSYIHDEPSAIIKSGANPLVVWDQDRIGYHNHEIEFQLLTDYSGDGPPLLCGIHDNAEEPSDPDDLKCAFSPTLGRGSLPNVSEEESIFKKLDRMKMVVEGATGLTLELQKQYKVHYYKNDKLIYTETLKTDFELEDSDFDLSAPSFAIMLPANMSIRFLNTRPSASYITRTCIASVLPRSCFLRPLGHSRALQISESQLSFLDENRFMGDASLSLIHPSFKLLLETTTDNSKLRIGLVPYQSDIDAIRDNENFLVVNDPEKGSLYECILETDDLNLDMYGVPVLDQVIELTFKCDGVVVKRCTYCYEGGGLHPMVIGSHLFIEMKNMDTDEAHRICSQSIISKKRFVVVGMTGEKSEEVCDNALEELEKSLISQLENHQEETRTVFDDAESNIEKSYAGGKVRAQLEVYRRNLELLVNDITNAWSFTSINITTNEGHKDLCDVIHQNQMESMALGDSCGLSQIVLEKIKTSEDTPALISRENCREFMDINEGLLAAGLKHISSMGKVLFLEHIDPWVAILDIPWFISVLNDLDTPPESTAGLAVHGLMTETPVWTDRELVKLCTAKSKEQTKLLLDLLVKSNQVIRLPGVRGDVKDVKSYIVNPAHLREPDVPLIHFYDPDKEEDNMMNFKVKFKFPLALLASTKNAMLCKCVQICKPIVVSPNYIVTQQGASQVVVLWKRIQDSEEEEELIINVKTHTVKDDNEEQVLQYASWVACLFEDVAAATLLSASTPYVITRSPQTSGTVTYSICAYHDWKGTPDSGKISVCTLCGNCSQKGMSCENNRIAKTWDLYQCKCYPYIYCCQTCGICPKCATKIWDARSKVRPYLDIEKAMTSQRAFWGSMAYMEWPMSPYTVNELTAVKVGLGESVKAINIGLLSEESDKFVQLFPGRALVGHKNQGYHQKSRNIITQSCIEENSSLDFNIGDRVTIQMAEAPEKSLDEDLAWPNQPMVVNTFYSINCAISRVSNTVANTRGDLGMIMSQLEITRNFTYFDAELLTVPKGEVTGIGMTRGKEVSKCIGHGTGHEATKGCDKWIERKFAEGDIIGCGVRSSDDLQIFFTHNDELICEHPAGSEDGPLYAAVLVQKDETIRILDNDVWKSHKDIKSETSQMPPNQELFNARDGSVSICPKETMLFDEPVADQRRVYSTVYVENRSQDYIIWKIKANFVERFTTDPIKGIIPPGELITYRAEIKTLGEPIEDIRAQFTWAPLPKYHISGSDDVKSVEKADQLWKTLKSSLEEKQQIRTMLCQWRSNEGQFEQVIENNFAEELWTTKYTPLEPSYKVNVMKNGGLVASYWLPKGEYRFAIETNTDKVNLQTAQQDIMVHMPRLPSQKPKSKKASVPSTCSELPIFTVQAVRMYNSVRDVTPVLGQNVALLSYLPEILNLKTLLYPSLTQLHDVASLKAYAVCSDHRDDDERGIGIHFLNRPGAKLAAPYSHQPPYGNSIIRYFYERMAMSKVVLPLYESMLDIKGSATRLQVESLMQNILYIYAMTGDLYFNGSTYRGKIPKLNIDPVDDEELPKSCTTKDAQTGDVLHRLYSELDVVRENPVPIEDVEETISKSPSLIGIVVDVSESDEKKKVALNLPEVRELTLKKNQPFGSQSDITIEHCTDLQTLLIMDADVPHRLERCSNLETLHLVGTLTSLPKKIGYLKNLSHLTINGMLETLPSSFSLLKSLTSLTITGDPFDDDTAKIMERKFMKDSSSLTSKEVLDDMCKMAIPHWDGESQVSTDKETNNLTPASYFYTSRIGHDYTDGDIHGAFPRQILQLTNLESLDLSYQAIRFIPRQISKLVHLRELKLRGCLELKHLPATLGSLPLVSLDLHYCVSLETPSRDIVERGPEAVLAHLKQMERGEGTNWRTKLMLVGIGGAGKTTLLRALMDDKNVGVPTKEGDITLGINIETWKARNEKRHPGKEVTFSVWDFAGQTVFYNTHQFFLSDRAIYMLVWSGRQGYENSSLDFWLSSIQAHTPDAPIFVVATHADQLQTEIPKLLLKEAYPQIVDFFLVGSTTGIGIPELKASLMDTALGLYYMGKKVPRVFVDLEERLISMRTAKTSHLDWQTVTKHAMAVGIEPKDVGEAVKFLHEVGSVQYFNYEILRKYIVIDPQWIVNAMSSIVTFKNTAIKNGRLKHKELHKVWYADEYPRELHDWLLKLTEMFDLTFQLDDEASLVPCLLPHDKSVETKWPPKQDDTVVQLMIIYVFRYLPTGLFNRLQARLFEFSNGKSIWKNGSTLEKNGHYALLSQNRDQKLIVEVIGPCPEGILFLIHETLEELINGSYRGVTFEYLIPCPECVTEIGIEDSAMFEASLIREASKLAIPYIQCRKLFHTVPMTVCKALMPPDDNLELDLQLQRSMHFLTEMKDSIKTDVFVLYCMEDLHTEKNPKIPACPRKVIKVLEKKGFKCYFKENMKPSDTHTLMVSMQEASTLMVFISNALAIDKNCRELLMYALQRFKDRLVIVNISPDVKWKNEPVACNIGQEVYTNMRKCEGDEYEKGLAALEETLSVRLGRKEKSVEAEPVCFLSYAWGNSAEATKNKKRKEGAVTACDPRVVKDELEKMGIRCWLDIEQTGKRGLFEDITEGLRTVDVVVAFVSEEYAKSSNCMMEFRFAVVNLSLPVILISVGTGTDWKQKEVGILAVKSNAPIIDMQKDASEDKMLELVTFVRSKLLSPEKRAAKLAEKKKRNNKISIEEIINVSIQEEFELAQRKVMRLVTRLSSQGSSVKYPNLFTLDFVDEGDRVTSATPKKKDLRKMLIKRRSSMNLAMSMSSRMKEDNIQTGENDAKIFTDNNLCIRFLCEHEQGWHLTDKSIDLSDMSFAEKENLLSMVAPYMARILPLLESQTTEHKPLVCLQGDHSAFKLHIIRMATESERDFESAYQDFQKFVLRRDEELSRGNLKRCLLSGGRVRWLCSGHGNARRVTELAIDSSEGSRTGDHRKENELRKIISESLPKFEHLRKKPKHKHTYPNGKDVAELFVDNNLINLPAEPGKGVSKEVFTTAKTDEELIEAAENNKGNIREKTTLMAPVIERTISVASVAESVRPHTAERRSVTPSTPPTPAPRSSSVQSIRSQASSTASRSSSRVGSGRKKPKRNPMQQMTPEEAFQAQMAQSMQAGLASMFSGEGGDGQNTSQACTIL